MARKSKKKQEYSGLDFRKFPVHLVMPSLRYTIGIPLDSCKILVPKNHNNIG